MEKAKILYVDDEEINLSNFRMAFEDEYAVLTAISGDEALFLFEREGDIAVVVADHRMPGMTGVELLAKIFEMDPDPVRMILTAYTDVKDIIDAINSGRVYHYILKPWEEDRLRISLHRAAETYLLTKENKHLSRRVIQVVEEERKRIACDLHDEFGQILPILQYSLETIRDSLPAASVEQRSKFEQVAGLVEQLGDIGRSIASKLRPDTLDRLGLISTIEWCIKGFAARCGDIKVDFKVIGARKTLAPEIEIVLYRIFQESLNNISKYAKAKHVEVLLTFSYPNIILTMRDDGIGFDPEENFGPPTGRGGRIGLVGMRERVASVDGKLTIHSRKGKGTVIRAELPIV